MLVPNDLYTVPEVMAQSGYSFEQVLQWGATGDVFFLVMVMNASNQLGPCQVPKVDLMRFIAGADTLVIDAMPEVYSGEMFGPCTIKRESLRIVGKSWDAFYSPLADSRRLSVPQGQTVPVQRFAAQEAAILREIAARGLSHLALPKNQPGKAGVRAAIKNALAGHAAFQSEAVFKKAWERMAKNGDIVVLK